MDNGGSPSCPTRLDSPGPLQRSYECCLHFLLAHLPGTNIVQYIATAGGKIAHNAYTQLIIIITTTPPSAIMSHPPTDPPIRWVPRHTSRQALLPKQGHKPSKQQPSRSVGQPQQQLVQAVRPCTPLSGWSAGNSELLHCLWLVSTLHPASPPMPAPKQRCMLAKPQPSRDKRQPRRWRAQAEQP